MVIQAAWAVVQAAFSFAPTLLLRVILEYVDDPRDTPKNVAWLFAILLFVTAVITAIGTGQSLHIGRRISLRLRVVIIGEIYSKALRRKAAVGSDNVLGEKKDCKDEGGKDEEGQANVGAIINLMYVIFLSNKNRTSTDVFQIGLLILSKYPKFVPICTI